jgi:hypothetical protein
VVGKWLMGHINIDSAERKAKIQPRKEPALDSSYPNLGSYLKRK